MHVTGRLAREAVPVLRDESAYPRTHARDLGRRESSVWNDTRVGLAGQMIGEKDVLQRYLRVLDLFNKEPIARDAVLWARSEDC